MANRPYIPVAGFNQPFDETIRLAIQNKLLILPTSIILKKMLRKFDAINFIKFITQMVTWYEAGILRLN